MTTLKKTLTIETILKFNARYENWYDLTTDETYNTWKLLKDKEHAGHPNKVEVPASEVQANSLVLQCPLLLRRF